MYLEPYQTSLMKLLAVVFSLKRSIIDISQGSKYDSAASFLNIFSLSLFGYFNEYMNILFFSDSVLLLCSCDVNQNIGYFIGYQTAYFALTMKISNFHIFIR